MSRRGQDGINICCGTTMIDKAHVGPFQILERLGTNRRHRVFHARQTEQDRDVALKFIHLPPDVDRQTAFSKIQREAEILKTLKHPNLVRVYGAGTAGEDVFFAHELIRGESLTTMLSRRGKLATDLAVELAMQIADALAYLHEQEIVHSKLTPDKILIDDNGKPHLTDVRLNRAKRRAWDATHRRELDAAAYMAPEQFNDGATAKSDLYALGAIMFEMLTGRIPLEPESLASVYNQKTTLHPPSMSSIVLDCPIWLDRLITALLDPDAALRPHSARAVFYALLEIRKIDKNKTAVVNQMTAGFNPLTIGADKTEARRLLGQLDIVDNRPPMYQRTWVQILSLALVIAVIACLVWPASNQLLFRRGQKLIESTSIDEVSAGKDCFQQIVDRRWNDRWTNEADYMIETARGKILLLNAQAGKQSIEPSSNFFYSAYRSEQQGNKTEALRIYNQLLRNLANDSQYSHIANEARKRIEEIGKSTSGKTEVSDEQ